MSWENSNCRGGACRKCQCYSGDECAVVLQYCGVLGCSECPGLSGRGALLGRDSFWSDKRVSILPHEGYSSLICRGEVSDNCIRQA
jgi:hypothetical protein